MSIAPLASMEPAVAAVAAVSDLLPAGWDNDWSIVQEDVSDMSARELRVLASRLFRALDEDFPPYGAQESYAVVVEELDQREARARQQQPEPGAAGDAQRETFRDNPLMSRFELFTNRTLIGYVKYDLRAGQISLLETVAASLTRAGALSQSSSGRPCSTHTTAA